MVWISHHTCPTGSLSARTQPAAKCWIARWWRGSLPWCCYPPLPTPIGKYRKYTFRKSRNETFDFLPCPGYSAISKYQCVPHPSGEFWWPGRMCTCPGSAWGCNSGHTWAYKSPVSRSQRFGRGWFEALLWCRDVLARLIWMRDCGERRLVWRPRSECRCGRTSGGNCHREGWRRGFAPIPSVWIGHKDERIHRQIGGDSWKIVLSLACPRVWCSSRSVKKWEYYNRPCGFYY